MPHQEFVAWANEDQEKSFGGEVATGKDRRQRLDSFRHSPMENQDPRNCEGFQDEPQDDGREMEAQARPPHKLKAHHLERFDKIDRDSRCYVD